MGAASDRDRADSRSLVMSDARDGRRAIQQRRGSTALSRRKSDVLVETVQERTGDTAATKADRRGAGRRTVRLSRDGGRRKGPTRDERKGCASRGAHGARERRDHPRAGGGRGL